MEAFGKSRQEYLAKFLELLNGIPDSDTFRRVFEKLNPSELSSCLINWVSVERNSRGTVAIDGKTICGSGNDKHRAYHVVSAFVAENQLTLGEICVEEKTNEITAVPKLLDLIDVKGDIVTDLQIKVKPQFSEFTNNSQDKKWHDKKAASNLKKEAA